MSWVLELSAKLISCSLFLYTYTPTPLPQSFFRVFPDTSSTTDPLLIKERASSTLEIVDVVNIDTILLSSSKASVIGRAEWTWATTTPTGAGKPTCWVYLLNHGVADCSRYTNSFYIASDLSSNCLNRIVIWVLDKAFTTKKYSWPLTTYIRPGSFRIWGWIGTSLVTLLSLLWVAPVEGIVWLSPTGVISSWDWSIQFSRSAFKVPED